IETSCDETAAAVVKDGTRILSSVVASQVEVHREYGGVVPELASRRHIESIAPAVEQALNDAGTNQKRIDGVAVTRGPGLVGALLVGFSFARAYAYALELPWVGVDHLEGHLNSVFLSEPSPEFPFVALLASGGHTGIYLVNSYTQCRCLGHTRDDAAGEAFDKVAKMLDLGYPGGVVISQLAESGDPERFRFPRAYLDKHSFDFSFSGIKTAVKRHIETHENYREHLPDIAAGFEAAVVEVLADKLIMAAEKYNCQRIALVGGVAANTALRRKIVQEAESRAISFFVPDISLCGDNGAMIAACGYRSLADPEGPRGRLDDDVYSRAIP
ncbi:MAG: tRNA (adenosine(37)-N6)-threonylcarbamoyltransferase complex transferase subunit TsaD, partial [Desulfobacteraceae bacterium]|nr:tRNA (adenosine(37)-N6)-threonylcarbamoyltransferase complex transferase subunit TsaD [Desulfobacteraceae bacterium]